MSMFREQLILRALGALCEIADECGSKPAARSLGLRFILAYTFVAAGADPKSKWIWDNFWTHATAAADPKRPLDAYIRGTGARGAFTGICREIGFPADHVFLQTLRAQAKRRPGSGAPTAVAAEPANDEAIDDEPA
ncbi:MAG TPA: hypothetical protein VFO69_07935 [Allosphingosinicella sp.]|nr:hypothetical protein [Allosphingosinicella sp.]